MPEVINCAISGMMIMMGEQEKALKNLLDFSAYLRPSEGMCLRPEDVIPPASGETLHTALVLFPFEREERSKTHDFVESILLDSEREPELGDLLVEQAERQKGNQMTDLWNFSAKEFGDTFRLAAQRLQLEKLSPVPYMNRGGGVTRDALMKLRDKEERRRRGRWVGQEMVRRYEKTGRVEHFLNKVPRATVEFGRYVRENWMDCFHGSSRLQFPPSKAMKAELVELGVALEDEPKECQLLVPRGGPSKPRLPVARVLRRPSSAALTHKRPAAVQTPPAKKRRQK